MEKSKETKLIGIIASVFLLFIVGVASFAYFGSFNVDLNNNVAVNINAVSPGNASFVSSATQLNLQVPAANMSQTAADNETPAAENTATLTVNLTGAANLLTKCTYDIVYEYDTNSNVYGVSPTTKNGDKEITLQVSGINGTNNFASEKNFDSTTISSYKNGNVYTLVSGAIIESDGTLTTQNISITGKYYNLTISQSSLEGKAFTGKIYVTNHKCETIEPAYITLLNAYGGKDSITELPDSAFASVTTASDKGMYKKDDDLGTSYYFRGAVNNNWVKFGKYTENGPIRGYYNSNKRGYKEYSSYEECNASESYNFDCSYAWKSGDNMYWRIIRINGDGSIRMIYSGTTNPSNDSSAISSNGVTMTGMGTQIGAGLYDDDSLSRKNEYIGYQYIEGEQNGYGKCDGQNIKCTVNGNIVYNSAIKQTIDKWYVQTTMSNSDALKISDAIYCNDRSAASTQTEAWTSTGTYYYGAYGRLSQSTKSPILTCPTKSDKFTVNTSNGNGALTYPVGLITADEVAMAGGKFDTVNKNFYLYTKIFYWTNTPSFNDSLFNEQSGYLFRNSYLDNTPSTLSYIRPVISLVSSVKLSGNGTYTNPYVVE